MRLNFLKISKLGIIYNDFYRYATEKLEQILYNKPIEEEVISLKDRNRIRLTEQQKNLMKITPDMSLTVLSGIFLPKTIPTTIPSCTNIIY